jgi:hypothetical protein
MLLFHKYQVIEDGCLINNDTGEILWPRQKQGKVPFHIVRDDNGRNHYFDVPYLLEKLKDDKRLQTLQRAERGY